MDASMRSRAEQLVGEIASQARIAEDLNDLMRLMMKSALERMIMVGNCRGLPGDWFWR
jgi:hypothetical protein